MCVNHCVVGDGGVEEGTHGDGADEGGVGERGVVAMVNPVHYGCSRAMSVIISG